TIIYYQNKRMQSKFIYERKLNKRWTADVSVGQELNEEGTSSTGLGVDFFYKKSFK
ncbi:MAG: hypothetical protein GXO31_08360, partial [Epsilonproteobacteria bacterium]|nr:hypothetical protein [Campylobacterota bacterium]